ncbi:hypothetical protein N0V95_003662, partial [Ascochyta clinopodiicola]
MPRYYASALTPTDHAALARGEKNHNLQSWTPKDLVLHAELKRKLVPVNLHLNVDNK